MSVQNYASSKLCMSEWAGVDIRATGKKLKTKNCHYFGNILMTLTQAAVAIKQLRRVEGMAVTCIFGEKSQIFSNSDFSAILYF